MIGGAVKAQGLPLVLLPTYQRRRRVAPANTATAATAVVLDWPGWSVQQPAPITDSLTAPAREAAPIGYYLSPVSLAPAAQGRWHVRHTCPNRLLVEELEDGGNGRSTPPTSEGRVPRAIWPAA